MKKSERINDIYGDLRNLYNEFDIRNTRINKYIESLRLDPGMELLEYPKGSRYDISDSIYKTDIFRISGDIIEMEHQLIKAVEMYLKVECYDLYIKNDLKQAFEKVRIDDEYRAEMIKIIEKFICE